MLKKQKKLILMALVLCLILPIPAFSQPSSVANKVIEELSVIQGVFIKTKSNRNIINRGLKDNIRKGDIWTIFSKGEQIIDPSTGKSLGSFPVAEAVCRVKRVEASFSEVQVKNLSGHKKTNKIKSGETASRFNNVDAVFMDLHGDNYSLYKSIRAGLPSLNWKGYKKIEQRSSALPMPYGVLILSERNQITVWSGGEILMSENFAPAGEMVSGTLPPPPGHSMLVKPAAIRSAASAGAVSSVVVSSPAKVVETAPAAPAPLGSSPVLLPAPNPASSVSQNKKNRTKPINFLTPGLASNIKIKKYRSAGSIDKIVLNMGIMNSVENESPFFVYLSGQTIFADSIDGKEHYKYTYEGFGEILNMITGRNNLIVLNIFVKDEGMHSRILSFENGKFNVVMQDISYILSMVDTNGDGINDALYGQEFDDEDFLGTNTYLLSIKSGRLKRIKKITTLPSFNLMGAFICDFNHNGVKDIGFYNAGRKFVIYEKNKEIWESSSILCGSVKTLLYDDPMSEFDAPKQISIWAMPAIMNLNNRFFAAVPANESGLLSVVGGGPEKGGLGILYNQDNNYILRKIDSQFQGAVQSVFTYKNELYISVVQGNFFTGQGRTSILAVPLNKITGE